MERNDKKSKRRAIGSSARSFARTTLIRFHQAARFTCALHCAHLIAQSLAPELMGKRLVFEMKAAFSYNINPKCNAATTATATSTQKRGLWINRRTDGPLERQKDFGTNKIFKLYFFFCGSWLPDIEKFGNHNHFQRCIRKCIIIFEI